MRHRSRRTATPAFTRAGALGLALLLAPLARAQAEGGDLGAPDPLLPADSTEAEEWPEAPAIADPWAGEQADGPWPLAPGVLEEPPRSQAPPRVAERIEAEYPRGPWLDVRLRSWVRPEGEVEAKSYQGSWWQAPGLRWSAERSDNRDWRGSVELDGEARLAEWLSLRASLAALGLGTEGSGSLYQSNLSPGPGAPPGTTRVHLGSPWAAQRFELTLSSWSAHAGLVLHLPSLGSFESALRLGGGYELVEVDVTWETEVSYYDADYDLLRSDPVEVRDRFRNEHWILEAGLHCGYELSFDLWLRLDLELSSSTDGDEGLQRGQGTLAVEWQFQQGVVVTALAAGYRLQRFGSRDEEDAAEARLLHGPVVGLTVRY